MGVGRKPKTLHSVELFCSITSAIASGKSRSEACKEVGVSARTYFRWKKDLTAIPIDKIARSKQFEDAMKLLQHIESSVTQGETLEQACAQVDLSPNALLRWKDQWERAFTAHSHRIKDLELENQRLKQMVVRLALDKQILKELVGQQI